MRDWRVGSMLREETANDDLIVRIPENEAEGELWSYEM